MSAISTLPILLAFLLAAAGQEASVEEPEPALVDRFMAAIPPGSSGAIATDIAEVARLAELNPGREAEVRRLLDEEAACSRRVQAEITRMSLRTTARSLGRQRLVRMIAFFEGEDFRRLDAISARTGGGVTASEAERAEIQEIMSRYPLDDFQRAMMANVGVMTNSMGKFQICRSQLEEGLGRSGLRTLAGTG